jgi:PAS domain S-box-containing protein
MPQNIDLSLKEPFFSRFGFHRTQLLLEKIPSVVAVLDAEQRIIYLNETGEKIYQCPLATAQGRGILSLLFVTDTEDITNALNTAYQGKVVFNLRWSEEQYYEGRLFWREATFIPFRANSGTVENVVVIINDITDLMRGQKRLLKGQEQYRMIFECAPEGILILERYYIRGANPAWENLTGYKQEEVLGSRIEQISPHDQPTGQASQEMLESIINKGLSGQRQSFEWQWEKKTGEIINSCVTLAGMSNFFSPAGKTLVQLIVRQC